MLGNVFSYLILTNQIDIAEPKIYHHLGFFTRIGDFTWRVSDCEELVGHLMEHLGRNATNYFMY